MNFEQYSKNEIEHRNSQVNESTQQIGETDKFKGNKFVGPHHHEYILWAPNIGWGKTGDALDDPKKGAVNVPTHEHMIVDGKVLEAAGHTHELLAPSKTFLSTDPPKRAVATVETEPQTGGK